MGFIGQAEVVLIYCGFHWSGGSGSYTLWVLLVRLKWFLYIVGFIGQAEVVLIYCGFHWSG